MACNEEMIGAGGPVPIGILISQNGDVVLDDVAEALGVVVAGAAVEVVDDVGDGDRQEEGVGVVGVRRRHPLIQVELVDDLAFRGVDVFHRRSVEQRWLSLSVHPHLEPLLHLYIAPSNTTFFN